MAALRSGTGGQAAQGAMKLIIEDDEGRRTVVPLFRDELIIGRAEGSPVQLTDKDVSRRHARLVRRSGRLYVEDLNSFTGVRVNGERVRGTREVREGDLIEISQYDLKLETGPDEKSLPDPGSARETTARIRGAWRAFPRSRARVATFVLIVLVAAAVATALWLREVRGAEPRSAASATGASTSGSRSTHSGTTDTDRITNPEKNTKTSRGSVPPDPRGLVR
jgi:pSer/pThr/pTyr-binding forkhead associated (FHA) protein